jgi:murE/murF fusion protein
MAANFFNHPSKELQLVGVTGTNGKTTTAYLLESILKKAGARVGVLGTVSWRFNGREFPAPNTTPDSYEFQRMLREMVSSGVTHVVAEVSSHALDLKRVDEVHFDRAVFTNFSRDHLDYHHDMENYFQAKHRLFSEILPRSGKSHPPWAIINGDDPWGARLLREITTPTLTFGLAHTNDFHPRSQELSRHGIAAEIVAPDGIINIKSPLLGQHNLMNILAAVATACSLYIRKDDIAAGISATASVPGRMERVSTPREPAVFVDYAHTEDALKNVLSHLAQFKTNRIITVFGCGGNRDRGKRAPMGAAATAGSEVTIITSDNPRNESPEDIIAAVEAGINREEARKISLPEAAGNVRTGERVYLVCPERRLAIQTAINMAAAEDLVLIAGKGHENYQLIGDTRLDFDDRLEARQALDRRHPKGQAEISATAIAEDAPCFTAGEVQSATQGQLTQGEPQEIFRGVSTDSRTLRKGNLFIPLVGKNYDGHDFITQAVKEGAAGYLHEEGKARPEVGITAIKVSDCLQALGDLARFWRRRMTAKVIAVTGSAGKTTVKEMTASILTLAGPTLKTEGNFNNLVGLPLTLLRLRDYHRLAVVELGMNQRGEIARLTQIAEPEVGLITNVGPAHLENLQTLDNIREEKGDIFRNLLPGGIAVINLDDEAVRTVSRDWTGHRVTFSLTGPAELTAADILPRGKEGCTFTIRSKTEKAVVHLAAAGRHQVTNALAAAACAWACGIDLPTIAGGLSSFVPLAGRFVITPLAGGIFLVDDSYNANPASLTEALHTVTGLRGGGRVLAVLGDMRELGDESKNYHVKIGTLAARLGVDCLLLKGEWREALACGARRGGLAAADIHFFEDSRQAVNILKEQLLPRDWVLVKGSRLNRLEDVVREIKKCYPPLTTPERVGTHNNQALDHT